jgi:hypothetical protein
LHYHVLSIKPVLLPINTKYTVLKISNQRSVFIGKKGTKKFFLRYNKNQHREVIVSECCSTPSEQFLFITFYLRITRQRHLTPTNGHAGAQMLNRIGGVMLSVTASSEVNRYLHRIICHLEIRIYMYSYRKKRHKR